MMNKKLLNAIFCAILILATGLFSSCKDYDEDIAGLDNRVKDLETKTKALQNQLEDAIANGCWIEYYDIDQATGNCTLHFLGKSETLTIPSIEGKDAIMRHFKVVNGTWQYAVNDGVYSEVRNAVNNNPVKVTVDEDGKQVLGNISIQTLETEDAGTVQVIYIGDVQTTIKCDQNDPILAVDEENKYMVVSVGSVHYMLLLEGSSFKGLQSVSYRRASAFDDYVEAMTLVDERGTVIMASSAVVSFRVLPADFKLEQAKFACEDVRQLKTRAITPSLSYVKNSATLESGILTLALEPKDMEDDVYFGAVLNVDLNGYKTTSDDFVVKKSTRSISEAKAYRMNNGMKEEITGTLVFDDKKPFYLNSINCGFEVGRNKTLESLRELGFDVVLDYELSEECEENFTIGKDDNGDYLAVKPLAPANTGTVTIVYAMNDEAKTVLLKKDVKVEAKSIDILLGAAEEGVDLSAISSLHTKGTYISLNIQPLIEEGIDVSTLFSSESTLRVGYAKDGKLTVLDKDKVFVTQKNGTGNGFYLFVDKQTDMDKLTGSDNNRTFDLYLLSENGAAIQVPVGEGVKQISLKKVNFYYKPYFKVREGMDKEYVIFDNGGVDNNISDINLFSKASIKGKAIVGRTVDGDNYSFENIKFSELYDWSPEDYVTFSISQGDQTDHMRAEWGKTFEYNSEDASFSVHKPCNLRKLNFGNDQKAEKWTEGDKKDQTIPNTDSDMKAKGGNEGLKIRYTIIGKQEGIDNWYFLDPISSPGDRWFYFHYRFNMAGADQIYCYAGAQGAGSQMDVLRCLTNMEGLSAANAEKLQTFISNMCWDWYFTAPSGSNNIVSVVAKDENTSEIVVSEWAKQRYRNIVVSFVGPGNNQGNFTYTPGADPKNFIVTNVKDLVNTQMDIKITTDFGEQSARFTLKKR
ncbi:hypothetical protein [Bacteroides caccae]|uniref:hypothetical protein n=1 Tax=Bacteroides caccae TaxID=47678 RepID=UPI003563450C